jgi:predicted neuraminidase
MANHLEGKHAMTGSRIVQALTIVVLGWGSEGIPGQEASKGTLMKQPKVLQAEFIYDEAPFDQCHASTIAQSPDGLVVAWFGGTREGRPDVSIWCSRQVDKGWTAPTEVAKGISEDGKRYPCWNPVLFQAPGGPLLLFYKVGPNPRAWWGMLKRSEDGGHTWSKAERLPDEIAGPIKNKPVLLADGTLLCGSSTESEGWRVHMERTNDLGKTWDRTGVLNDGKAIGAIQPTILQMSDGQLKILCRSRQGKIATSQSSDGGKTWESLTLSELPNPNSGIDGVTLSDGRHLLVYNHTTRGRSPLNVAVSDNGENWKGVLVLEDEPGEYSYPAVIQTSDGLVHITYTWKRLRIKHVVLDPQAGHGK